MVNGHMVTLDYQLENGDFVQILTSKSKVGPSRDWQLHSNKYVTTRKAIASVRHWFKNQYRDHNIARGRDIVS